MRVTTIYAVCFKYVFFVSAMLSACAQARVSVPGKSGTYTSDKAVAILLRWHISRPGHVIGQRVRDSLIRAITGNTQLNWLAVPTQWADMHEHAITGQR